MLQDPLRRPDACAYAGRIRCPQGRGLQVVRPFHIHLMPQLACCLWSKVRLDCCSWHGWLWAWLMARTQAVAGHRLTQAGWEPSAQDLANRYLALRCADLWGSCRILKPIGSLLIAGYYCSAKPVIRERNSGVMF